MLNDLNGARLLVVLPLNERQRALLREAAPAAQFRFADDAPALADVLWAEGILGHVPVELVRQNRSRRQRRRAGQHDQRSRAPGCPRRTKICHPGRPGGKRGSCDRRIPEEKQDTV